MTRALLVPQHFIHCCIEVEIVFPECIIKSPCVVFFQYIYIYNTKRDTVPMYNVLQFEFQLMIKIFLDHIVPQSQSHKSLLQSRLKSRVSNDATGSTIMAPSTSYKYYLTPFMVHVSHPIEITSYFSIINHY